MSTNLERLQMETLILSDVLSVAVDLASQVEPKPGSADELSRLQSMLLLLMERAEQLHQITDGTARRPAMPTTASQEFRTPGLPDAVAADQ